MIDFRHGIHDRSHHHHCQDMHISDDDGEIGKQQKVQWLLDEMGGEHRAVENAFPAEKRDPGNHADHVRSEERNRAGDQQSDAPVQRPHVEREKIGDEEADHHRDRLHQRRIFQRLQIEPDGDFRREDVKVVVEHEGRKDFQPVVVEKAHHDHEHERGDEHAQQHGRQRRGLQPGDQRSGPGPPEPARDGQVRRGAFPASRRPRHAAIN